MPSKTDPSLWVLSLVGNIHEETDTVAIQLRAFVQQGLCLGTVLSDGRHCSDLHLQDREPDAVSQCRGRAMPTVGYAAGLEGARSYEHTGTVLS